MTLLKALLLGIIQGITEFLPISSSGHLVIFQKLFGLTEPVVAFDVFLHLASLLAIVIFFWSKIRALKLRQWVIVGIGTIPAVIVGFFLKDSLEALFSSTKLVGVALLITGLINFFADKKLETGERTLEDITWRNALIIGLFQAVAITPGISRSGSTLAGGLSQKLKRTEAFDFAFLLAIPAILGASALQILDLLETGFADVAPGPFLLGGVAAFLSGLGCLAIFRYIINRARLEWFAWYCFVVGAATLIFL